MHLFELFGDPPLNIKATLTSAINDSLAALLASGVQYVTIDSVVADMARQGTGVRIDRALVMQLLDPTVNKIVKKVEGDRVYLSLPVPEETKTDEDDHEKNQQKVAKSAVKHAKKAMKKKSAPVKKGGAI